MSKSKFYKNYLFNLIIIFFNIIFPILLFPYATRILTPEYYGKYSFALSISYYFVAIANLGIPTYGIKEISKSKLQGEEKLKETISELFYITILSSLTSFIFYIILISNISIFMKDYKLFLVMGISIIFSFITLDYYFIAMEQHKRRSVRIVVTKFISLIGLFYFVKVKEDYIKFALILIIPELIAQTLDFYQIKRYLIFDLKKLNIKKHIKSIFLIFFNVISSAIYLNVDSTMLGFFKGDIAVGNYSIASKMSKVLISLVSSLSVVLAPSIIKNITEENNIELYKNMKLYFNFIFFTSIPAIFFMFIFSKEMVILFSGEQYINSVDPMKLMLPIILFISISIFTSSRMLIPMGKEKTVLYISLIGMFINVILNYIFIPKLSVTGAAIGTLVSETVVALLGISAIKKSYNDYRIFDKNIMLYLYSNVFIFTIILYFKKNYLENLNKGSVDKILISFTAYALIYIVLLYLKKEFFVCKAIEVLREKIRENYKMK